ncbi:hypothetical protein [Chroococcidiopsis sp.]|uniref:hypothetical protein n=1 Tax=Chroococcidiopsis sp. TaxID=3088168 RepID=UPI003F3A8C6D
MLSFSTILPEPPKGKFCYLGAGALLAAAVRFDSGRGSGCPVCQTGFDKIATAVNR